MKSKKTELGIDPSSSNLDAEERQENHSPDPSAPTEEPDPAPVTLPHRPQPKYRGLFWSLFRLVLLGASSGTAVAGFIWLTQVPPTPDCGKPVTLSQDEDKLYCIQQAAFSGDLKKLQVGIKLVKNWPKDDPRYAQAQQFLKQWSTQVLSIARQQAGRNQVKQAIATAQSIPNSSPLYRDAQTAIAAWKRDQDQGSLVYDKFIAALQSQKWAEASDQILALSRLPSSHWRQRIQGLRQQLTAERQAWEYLQEARALADSGSPELLGEAIALAQKIGPKRLNRPEAQAEIVRWSRSLLETATVQLQAQDFTGAIVVAQFIPPKSSVGEKAKTLIQFVQAQQLTDPEVAAREPVPNQFKIYWSAVTAGRQLASDQPLFAIVQPLLPVWEEQLKDLTRLQVAQTLAGLGQLYPLQLAIQEAKAIPPGRIQRLRAQTLVASWRKEMQRLVDRPYLLQAQNLAAGGRLEDLEAAIAKANLILPGRPLRLEAQSLIARWKREILILEDQPILERAQILAQQQKYPEAIALANRVGPERPLYRLAQSAANQWAGQIRLLADQATLTEANTLASARNFLAAIEVASQLPPESPLYNEAQTAISIWSTEQSYEAPIEPEKTPPTATISPQTSPVP
ncbi:hypothetical protein BST81_17735 [Leptolyngbya sp. 'hensonii']|uniref:hypothetical protein n=1 Tax=Leptolyngbya sp. 'hensonii' TaxID=1922337 RepID=UPI0009502286|nr:hypothetical protein [Leptolyngbya sp. 'hensonii']OLP17190.1 hypothetical protein BST81_17735 [Leptolyngbya sp. 'hensonii']